MNPTTFFEMYEGEPDLHKRERRVEAEIKSVAWQAARHEANGHVLDFEYSYDYLGVAGVPVPMTPMLAMKLAQNFQAVLPTPRLVDVIYHRGDVRRIPAYPQRVRDLKAVRRIYEACQRYEAAHPGTSPPVGHRKDIVVCNRLKARPHRVAIYGWHGLNGHPIQPLTTVHAETYLDYSHGVRLIKNDIVIDGQPWKMSLLYGSAVYGDLVSSEVPMTGGYCNWEAWI